MAGVNPGPGAAVLGARNRANIRAHGPSGQWHDAKIRSILRANGYHVAASGGYNPKVHQAWMSYLLHTDHGQNPKGARVGAAAWNAANAGSSPSKPASAAAIARQEEGRGFVPGRTPGNMPIKGNAAQVSARNAVRYNKAHGIKSSPAETRLAGVKTDPKAGPKGGPKGGGGPKGNGNNPSPMGPAPTIGKPISEKLAGMGNINSIADAMAGAQYDPQIHDLMVQAAQNPNQAAQDQADIGSWYGAVQQAMQTAGSRDKSAADAAAAAQQAAVKSLMGSLGDSASSGLIGAQGAQDLSSIQQTSLADQQYHNDMSPILQQAQAAAAQADKVRMQNALQGIQEKLLEARGARGQLEASDLNQLNQQGIDRLLQIKQYNNSLKQQNYQNALSAQEAAVAAAMTGAQINSLKASTKAASGAAGHIAWNRLRPDQQAALIDEAMKPYVDSAGSLVTKPLAVRNSVMEYLRGLGYSSARKVGVKGVGVNPRAQAGINNLVNSRIAAAQAAAAHQAQLNG